MRNRLDGLGLRVRLVADRRIRRNVAACLALVDDLHAVRGSLAALQLLDGDAL